MVLQMLANSVMLMTQLWNRGWNELGGEGVGVNNGNIQCSSSL